MKAQTVLCEAISEDIGSVRLTSVDVPDPGPDEVRVRLKACADPYVCRGFALEDAVSAMRLLENREVIGKTVVTMNGYTL